MIKFFRRIRQQLLSQNKFSKYMLYAIGEILLVVIGILIALQLNIQKEESNQNKIIQELLLGIQVDLKSEVERIDYLNDFYNNITDAIQHIIIHQQGKEKSTNEELGRYFLHSFEFRKFSKININYQTLYGSGLLQKIEDQKLPEEIIRYYSRMYLEWSLEIYQTKASKFDFNQVKQFEPIDKLQSNVNYNSIPNFRLDISNRYQTNFIEFVQKPETLNFIIDLLNQSTMVFLSLKTKRESNLDLSKQIDNYLKQ